MFSLRVTINDKRTVVAGAEDLSVLSAIVTLCGKLGRRTAGRRGPPDMFLHLGGLTDRARNATNEHLDWLPHAKLKIGDRVLVELVKSETAGRIVRRRSDGSPKDQERRYFEHMKKEYLRLKDKYESEG